MQTLLSAKRLTGEKDREHPHYLKGSIYCGQCGSRLLVSYAKGRGGTYTEHVLPRLPDGYRLGRGQALSQGRTREGWASRSGSSFCIARTSSSSSGVSTVRKAELLRSEGIDPTWPGFSKLPPAEES